MILVIAEKPSVAQTIAAALGAKKKQDGYIEGDKYLISWCVGHLVQLADAAAYGEQYKKWSYDSLPILPQEWQYTVSADKGKQFATLKNLMHRTDISELKSGELTEGQVKELYAKAQETAKTAEQDKDTYSIYQLKHGDETRDLRFEPYDRLQVTGNVVDKANYELIYSAELTPGTCTNTWYR